MEYEFFSLIKAWDGEAVVVRYDRPTGSWIFVALHDTTAGPASGGTRMKSYERPEEGLRDALRLAEGMTCKWAAIDFDYGGGKAVLAVPHPLEGEERRGLLRRYGRLVETLGGSFGTGVDLGTTPEDMAEVARVTPHVHGVDRTTWETVDAGPFTARGVYVGVARTVRELTGEEGFAGRRVLVQGVGSVGGRLARLLRDAGAEVLVTDLDAARARGLADEIGARYVDAERALAAPCDVYAPCAVGATLSETSIPTLGCRAVAGSANNQLAAPEDARRLEERGILYAPDYVVNAGGAIAFSMLRRGETREAIEARIDRIGETLGEIFTEATEHGETPLQAAQRRVRRVLSQRRGEAG